jgi:arylsulfatase A-like enzyme
MRWKVLTATLLIILGVLTWFTFVKFRQAMNRKQISADGPRNVYLITATGLPADHLSSYLYQPIQTTLLDYLAYDGVRFNNAFTTSSDSLAAHLSLFTGLYPFRPTVRQTFETIMDSSKNPLPDLENTLPRRLQANGYTTAAFSADPSVRDFLFESGIFQEYFAGSKRLPLWESSMPGGEVTRLASDWIRKHRHKKHFVWINFNEPQPPFEPPEPFARHYAAHPFDGEIAYVDSLTGKFIHSLKQLKLYENAIVIFTSPFGEDVTGKGRTGSLRDQYLHIPLMITAPGLLPRQQAYENTVSLIDVFPTISALLQQPFAIQADGMPLFAKGSAEEIKREAIFGQSLTPILFGMQPVSYVRSGNWKLISGIGANLYYAGDKPANLLSGKEKENYERLRSLLIAQKIEIVQSGNGQNTGELLEQILRSAREKQFDEALRLLKELDQRSSFVERLRSELNHAKSAL